MNDAEWREAWALFRDASESHDSADAVRLGSADGRVAATVRQLLRDHHDELGSADRPESFARYQIVRLIGTGGMGAVYAARDPELHRTVALKFLGDRVAGLPADVLIAEAQAASALNHPNIVTIHDVLRAGDRVAMASELVEGSSLRTRCGAPVPLDDVLGWGRQIAHGLAAAHAAGIVHRDIKPENIMIRPDGLVKVLDFGLARRIEGDDTLSDVPLGTLGYMAPEQIRGEPLTGAADVFSLGVVLFELAAGVHPFLAETRMATTRAIVSAEPMGEAVGKPPAVLAPLLGRMLGKEPATRPAIGEVAAELDALRAKLSSGRPVSVRRRLLWSSLALSAAVVAFTVALANRADDLPRFREVPFTAYPGSETEPAFSPDGTRIAFTWAVDGDPHRDVYVKDLAGGEPLRLTEGDLDHYTPAWSPDGQWIALLKGVRGSLQDVQVVPASGGHARLVTRIADTEGYARPLAWWPDGESLIVRDASPDGFRLFRVFLSGAPPVAMTSPPPFEGDSRIAVSPDGQRVAFVRHRFGADDALCVVPADGTPADRATDPCMVRFSSIRSLVWRRDGRGLYVADPGALWFVAFDGRRAKPAAKIMDGAFAGLSADPGRDRLAFSRTFSNLDLWQMDVGASGARKIASSSTEDSEPQFSPDGTKLLFRSRRSGPVELWVSAADGSNLVRLTSLGGHVGSAVWSPDGRHIAFDGGGFPGSERPGIYVIPAAGGPVRRLTDPAVAAVVPGWSHDSQWVYYSTDDPQSDLWKVPAGGGDPVRVSDGPMWEPSESPDGSWLYHARPYGAYGIWRRPLTGGPEELLPGTEGARARHWLLHRDGVYFLTGTSQLSLQLVVPATGEVRTIASIPPRIAQGPRGLAVSPDGRTIVYAQEDLTLSDILLLEQIP